jgi:hypothetical protein
MTENTQVQIQAVEEHIEKLREMRQRWADGQDLTAEEKLKQKLTLELLDGAIGDLLQRVLRLKEQEKA